MTLGSPTMAPMMSPISSQTMNLGKATMAPTMTLGSSSPHFKFRSAFVGLLVAMVAAAGL
jgi:hypothetical protein